MHLADISCGAVICFLSVSRDIVSLLELGRSGCRKDAATFMSDGRVWKQFMVEFVDVTNGIPSRSSLEAMAP